MSAYKFLIPEDMSIPEEDLSNLIVGINYYFGKEFMILDYLKFSNGDTLWLAKCDQKYEESDNPYDHYAYAYFKGNKMEYASGFINGEDEDKPVIKNCSDLIYHMIGDATEEWRSDLNG